MDKAVISLSFDDGRKDNIDVVKNILLPLDIPATFNITTAYVDGTAGTNSPTNKPPMSIDDVIWLKNQRGIEIALHGDMHQNTPEDIAIGRDKLTNWLSLLPENRFGFASPGSGLDLKLVRKPNCPLFKNEIKYFRISARIYNKEKLRILCRKAGRILHIPFLYKVAYQNTIMHTNDDRIIYSVPILNDTTVKQITALVTKCIKTKGALTLMFHSIEDNPTNAWSWSFDNFNNLIDCLNSFRKSGLLDILTTTQLFDRLAE